jgi:cold shock CspA family protein
VLNGSVTSFDDHAGLGEVTSASGAVHPFHCTALTDGSRTIEVGAPVSFRVVAGGSGRREATQITRT